MGCTNATCSDRGYNPQEGVMPPAEVRVLDAKWEKMVISSKGIRWQVESKLSFTILALHRFYFCALRPFPRLF